MGTKEYSDEFDLQISFLKKMKDSISDKSIIEKHWCPVNICQIASNDYFV